MSGDLELVTVRSGARSLRSRAHGETFHPVIGPQAEAEALHVEQQRLRERLRASEGEFVIWDVGLGAGANALAVLKALVGEPKGNRVSLHSFDLNLDALQFALSHRAELGYFGSLAPAVEELMQNGHAVAHGMNWQLYLGDFAERLASAPAPDAILYDPYSPAANPRMWTLEHLTRVFQRLNPTRGCLLTSYSRSTAVRVTLLLAGFSVGHGRAIAEKEETTVASNSLELLERPLEPAWLERVRRSTHSAPLRLASVSLVIDKHDLTALAAHPQMVSAAL